MLTISELRRCGFLGPFPNIARAIRWTPAGPGELPVIEAMKTHRFETEGFARTYWDFYFGFGVIISAFLLLQAVVLWQLGLLARTSAVQLRPIVASFLVAFVVNAI